MSAFDQEREQLRRALSRARQSWDGTSAVWRDDVQREFAETCWLPLERAAEDVIDTLAALAEVVQDIERRRN